MQNLEISDFINGQFELLNRNLVSLLSDMLYIKIAIIIVTITSVIIIVINISMMLAMQVVSICMIIKEAVSFNNRIFSNITRTFEQPNNNYDSSHSDASINERPENINQSTSGGYVRDVFNDVQSSSQEPADDFGEISDRSDDSNDHPPTGTIIQPPDENYVLWKIDNFVEFKRNKTEIFSSRFCAPPNKYNMRLSMFPAGFGKYTNEYLSLLFHIISGSNDDNLSWPMMHEIKLDIINQQTDNIYENLSASFKYDTTDEKDRNVYFNPYQSDNIYGKLDFLHIDDEICRGDKITIKCTINE